MESEGIVRETKRIGGTGIMLAAVVGAAVGGGVALLFAPRSGKETRGWLAQKTRKVQQTTMSAYAQGKDAIQSAAKGIGEGDGDMASHIQPAYGRSVVPPTRS
jgi:gas vesicle protein